MNTASRIRFSPARSLPSRLALALLLGAAVLAGGGVVAAEPRDAGGQTSFAPAQRKLIDEGALWGPREKRNVSRVEAYGNALKWLVARTPLPVEEEIRRAAEKDEELRLKTRTAPAPPAAEEVFKRLIDHLPARMRPKQFEFTLTVLEHCDAEACALGAGRVYVSRDLLKIALADPRSGKEQLAFALAHQLGHLSLGHARRIYQRLWASEHVRRDLEGGPKKDPRRRAKGRDEEQEASSQEEEDEKLRMTLENLAGVGAILEHVYTRQEQFEADLFAIHLCRNAGIDVENCLDGLRRQAVAEDAGLLQERPPREGIPPVEPEVQPRTTGESFTLADHPTAQHRLRRLRLELDGLIYGDTFGLFEFDRRTKGLRRAADHSVPADGRVLICIHGMESSAKVYLPLMNRLAADPAGGNFRILGFQYPNDESLARSGKFLKRAMLRVCAAAKHVDFVCHSAGGLVFRQYAEVEGGEFHHVYFQGTPHYGSDLAALRSLLEATQFLGDLKLGYDGALQQAILDGHGQMSYDLQPDSLFLRHLNAPRDKPGRDGYCIYCGQASSRTRVLLMKTAVEGGRKSLERLLKTDETIVMKFSRAGLEKLVLPAEIANGDLAVTLESAKLSGVQAVFTHPLHHTELPRNPAVIEHLVKALVEEE